MASCWVVYSVKEVAVTVFLFYSYWCHVVCHILVSPCVFFLSDLVCILHSESDV